MVTAQHGELKKWKAFRADLSWWRGRKVVLRLVTDVGPADNSSSDWAMWGDPRIVLIDGYRVEAIPRGALLVIFADDKPGLIGNVGQLLGEKGINIAAMTFGRKSAGGQAITVLNLDGPIGEATLKAVRATAHVREAHMVAF